MKSRLLAAALSFLLFCVGCTKQNPSLTSSNEEKSVATENNRIIVSKWEPLRQWKTENTGDGLVFTKPIIHNFDSAVVLVFVRNLWKDDPTFTQLGEPDEPLMMPFNFLPFNKKPFYVETWNYQTFDKKMEVALNVSADDDVVSLNPEIELQYIIVPEDLLLKTGQTQQSLQGMSYSEVIKRFGRSS